MLRCGEMDKCRLFEVLSRVRGEWNVGEVGGGAGRETLSVVLKLISFCLALVGCMICDGQGTLVKTCWEERVDWVGPV